MLLPGLDGTGELFAPFQVALADRVSTIAVRYQDERVFDDYLYSVESLLPEENAVLVAESFSGPIALALMARHSGRIRCAVLCATFAISPFRFLSRLAPFAPAISFGPNPIQRAILRTFCFDKQSDPAVMAMALSVIRSVPGSTLKSRLNALAGVDVRPLLSQISTPVLCLRATRDRIVGAHLSQQLIDGLSNVTVHDIDGPHFLLQSRPKDCAEAISSYIVSR